MARNGSPEREQYQKTLMQLIGCRPVAYWPFLAKRVGGVKCAVLLSQLLYWNGDKTVIKRDGWVLKSVAEFEEETGLTQVEQATARDILALAGIVESRLAGIPRIWHYRVNLEKLEEALIDPQTHSMENSLNENPIECVSQSMRKRRNVGRDSRGMFTRKDGQLNKVIKTTDSRLHSETTSSSSGADESYPQDQSEEEEGMDVEFSSEVTSALSEIGVFKSLWAEVAAKGLENDKLLQLVEAAKAKAPGYGESAALFIHRLREMPDLAPAQKLSQEEREAEERRRRYSDSLQKWGINS